jgi:hypothetical protein
MDVLLGDNPPPQTNSSRRLSGSHRSSPLHPLSSHTSGDPRRRLSFYPIHSFETGFELVDWLNSAIRPLSLYFPMLAIFQNNTKYRNSCHFVSPISDLLSRLWRRNEKPPDRVTNVNISMDITVKCSAGGQQNPGDLHDFWSHLASRRTKKSTTKPARFLKAATKHF